MRYLVNTSGDVYRQQDGVLTMFTVVKNQPQWVWIPHGTARRLIEEESSFVREVEFVDLPVEVRELEVRSLVASRGEQAVADLIVGLRSLAARWHRKSRRYKETMESAAAENRNADEETARRNESFVRSCYQRYVDYDRRASDLEVLLRTCGWEV